VGEVIWGWAIASNHTVYVISLERRRCVARAFSRALKWIVIN